MNTTLSPYYRACSNCRLCEGAAYQMPPFLFAGSDEPDILVIAQNPGEMKDDWRFAIADYSFAAKTPEALKTIYDIDFITSHGYKTMGSIFGEGWLATGRFMYTNAVRCRTPGNKEPSAQMVTNCAGWTSQLPTPPLVVLMGKTAAYQFCTMVKKPELKPWKIVKLKGHGLTHIMTIPHYVAMKSHKEIEEAHELFEKASEMAGVS